MVGSGRYGSGCEHHCNRPLRGKHGEYLRELERLRALQPRWVYPSHGYPIGGSHALFAVHRTSSGARAANRGVPWNTPQREELVEQIYRDLHRRVPLRLFKPELTCSRWVQREGVRTSGRVGRSSLIHSEKIRSKDVEPGHIGGGQAADQCPCALGPHPFNGPPRAPPGRKRAYCPPTADKVREAMGSPPTERVQWSSSPRVFQEGEQPALPR